MEDQSFVHLEKGIEFSDSFSSDNFDKAADKIFLLLHNLSCTFAVIMSFILGFEYDKVWKKVKIKIDDKDILRVLVIIVLFLVLPLILIFITLSLAYKYLCSIIIKRKDKNFVTFLESFDVFWSLDDENKNIIEVLGTIEADSPDILVDDIREKLNNFIHEKTVEKIFYRRREQFGFCYWSKSDNINVSEYIKIYKVLNEYGLNRRDLEDIMTDLSHESLPYNGEGLFQVLVTDVPIIDEDSSEKYAIIFRIHHSVGDGIALIEFLCKILADERTDVPLFKPPEVYNLIEENMAKDFSDLAKKLREIVLCAVEGVIRKPDLNSLHGPMLEGKKYFKWIDTDKNLLQMVKEIKERKHVNFSDVLATALSSGLRDYFSQTMLHVPEEVAVIIPIRLSETSKSLILENNFTVSILSLPLTADLNSISQCCNRLRKSLDPLTNHYLLKLCNVFPKCILEPVFNSNQATMVFSNIPGPKSLSICGCALQSLVFFVPNKGTTGVGVTALCYGDVLRFAVMADSAVLSNPNDLTIILKGMVAEIENLYNQIE